jgi:hypothetical protein
MMERLFSDHHSLLNRVHIQRHSQPPYDEETAHRVTIATNGGDDLLSWDLPIPTLKDLGSLHENNLSEGVAGDSTPVQSPQHLASSSQTSNAQNSRRSSLTMLSKVMFGDTNSSITAAHLGQPTGPTAPPSHSTSPSLSEGSTTGAASTSTNPVINSSGQGSSGSNYLGKSLLSSVFGSVVGSGSTITASSLISPSSSSTLFIDSTDGGKSGESPASFFNFPCDDDEQMSLQRNNSSGSACSTTAPIKLICLRCKGTVEGPKFSTCKCLVPALSPDDLVDHGSGSSDSHVASGGNQSSSSSSRTFSALSGMFSMGSSAIAKATTSSVEGFMNYANNPLGDTSEHSGTNSPAPSPRKKGTTNGSSEGLTTISEVLVSTVSTLDATKEIVSDTEKTMFSPSTVENVIGAAPEQETAIDTHNETAQEENIHSNHGEDVDETTL